MPYLLPPAQIVEILDAPPTPLTSFSPDRRWMILVDYEAYPPLAFLARPFHKLAGARIDPTRPGTQRTTRYTSLTLVDVETGASRPIAGLPEGAETEPPLWAPDGRRFAFLRDLAEGGIELWLGDTASASCRVVPDIRLSDMLVSPIQWQRDSRHLLVTRVPDDIGPAPEPPLAPDSPIVQEASGKKSRPATYQDLLTSEFDEALFAHLAQVQLTRLDTESGETVDIGAPTLLTGVRASPDERFLLIYRLQRPFSYRVPYQLFARRTEVWDAATGEILRTIADLPVSDEVPREGVPLGPRGVLWQPLLPATLLWIEALDGGDPLAKVDHRDRIVRLDLSDPQAAPAELLRVVHRFAGWDWPDRENQVILTEWDRDRRWRTTRLLDLSEPDEPGRTLFDLSVNDAYADPGSFVYQVRPDGQRTLRTEGTRVYLSGPGATPEGNRPFLDAFDLATGATERLFANTGDRYETFLAFTADGERIFSRQSRTEPRNLFVEERPLTHFVDPHPQITHMHKELVRYDRGDGVPLSGTLYLPPGYDPQSGVKLPLLFWAYPEEYSDATTAGQVRGSDRTFTRLAGTSPLWFAMQGWAVLADAAVPVIGDPETMNDTFAEQIVAAAKAAIDYLNDRGLIDPERVVAAGHSYGAFMTACLLAAAPGLFAAGIARSGAYNRTLTPFGFQSERRSYWEARDVYHRLSPFTHADTIRDPILLIHGAADNNPGTHTIQSERFYQALAAHGATVRLVLLPHESHGYQARESVLHVLAEMLGWAQKYTAPG